MINLIIGKRYTSWRVKKQQNQLMLSNGLERWSLPEAQWPRFVRESPVVRRYEGLLGLIDWQDLPQRQSRAGQWPAGISYASFAAACLIKLDQGFTYMSQLRRYLVEHPALLWRLGWPLIPSSTTSWGFDAEASLPTARHLTRLLRQMPNAHLQQLLDQTVRHLQQMLSPKQYLRQIMARWSDTQRYG